MHELSIAASISDIAVRHAGGRRVSRIEVRVGHLRQVVPSALEFAFELVTQGTPLEGAELVLEEVAVTVRCRTCGAESRLAGFPLVCPCGSAAVAIVAGEELTVESLDVEEEVAYGR